MLKTLQKSDLVAERRKYITGEKTKLISVFLDECGEDADWEEWLSFLQRHNRVEGFEWTWCVDLT
ncbi:MAG: hypothetical protein ACN4GW_15530 [Desulforhopalus sp.]